MEEKASLLPWSPGASGCCWGESFWGSASPGEGSLVPRSSYLCAQGVSAPANRSECGSGGIRVGLQLFEEQRPGMAE